MTRPVYIASALRSPIGKYGGAFASTPAPDLGAAVVRGLFSRSGVEPREAGLLVFGHARQAGSGPNPARQVLHGAGIPVESPAYTVNMACASGLQAVALAAQTVAGGEADCAVAGGMENMSRMPYMLEPEARWGYRLGHQPLTDAMYRDGFACPLSGMLMGETAEKLASIAGISRFASDAYAAESQNRCEAARKAGLFRDEIVPVEVPAPKGPRLVEEDEHPRDGVTMKDLAALKPVFARDGVVTAGNASGITDGAAALLLTPEDFFKTHRAEPLARIVDWVSVGLDPSIMGRGPVPATFQLLARRNLGLDDVDLVEMNEAFACQVLACLRDLPVEMERLNVNGGAIALGHPIGCTGARILVTLAHEMKRRRARRGLATLCVSGGLGMAMLLERD
jgi:acetyl-CoA C-acetyltransferase